MTEPPREPGSSSRAGGATARGGPTAPGRPTIRAGWSSPAPSPTPWAPVPVDAPRGATSGPPGRSASGPAPGPTTATPSALGDALEKLVDTKGWSTDLSVRALSGPLAGPGRSDERRPLLAGVVRRHGPHGPDRVHRLGDLAADHGTPAGRQAQRAARRRHGDPGQGARAAGPVLEEGPTVGPGRSRSARHVRLSRSLSSESARTGRAAAGTTRLRPLGCAGDLGRPPHPGARHRARLVADAAADPRASTWPAGSGRSWRSSSPSGSASGTPGPRWRCSPSASWPSWSPSW